MDLTTGNGSDTGSDSWWDEENALPASPISAEITRGTGELYALSKDFEQGHSILTGIAANMRSGFILLNAAGQVAYSNPGAERLLGVNSSTLRQQGSFDVRKQLVSLAVDPNSAQAELDRIWHHPEQEGFTDLALADAAVRWLRVLSFPVRDDPGRLLGRGVLLDDITLERTATQTRNETLALAAHELKTPLAIIKGCATTLLGSSTRWDPSMLHEMLQMIDAQADRLHDILNTLLDVWKLDAGAHNLRLSQLNIVGLLKQVVGGWHKHTPAHRFVLRVPEEDILVHCDALRIEQALHHLLNNAATYSPAGSVINIELETNDIEIRISVKDQGAGIAPEHLERIFDRFYRIPHGEGSGAGNGLGLSVVRATVEAHGGKIWAESPGAGQGSAFFFTLPFAPSLQAAGLPLAGVGAPTAASRGSLPSSRAGLLYQSKRVKVLIAENDARIARYLRAHLEEQQYRVYTTGHGIQFLRQLDLEDFDILMLSTRLADMSGLELLQRLREFSQAPVVMLCDECDEDERVRYLDVGADDLLTKPFHMQELLARVRVLLRRKSSDSEQSTSEALFTTGDLTIDYAQHQVLLQDRPVQLSRTEYKLLSTLAQNVGRVMTHELLLERVWGAEYNREVDFIWVYISRLRRKIEADPRHPRYILTVPDVGYKLAKL
ncbi:MAG TPA: ATP-binding protein [Ktedonobacteraceae bacterium]|jgi:DNA-binding response OmpR family regulator/signal transduction histidine kinase|nr:ATP-binding protein [Ktedonobacteraceae bacterium]